MRASVPTHMAAEARRQSRTPPRRASVRRSAAVMKPKTTPEPPREQRRQERTVRNRTSGLRAGLRTRFGQAAQRADESFAHATTTPGSRRNRLAFPRLAPVVASGSVPFSSRPRSLLATDQDASMLGDQ